MTEWEPGQLKKTETIPFFESCFIIPVSACERCFLLTFCEVQSGLGAPWLTCKPHWLAHSACAQQTLSISLPVSVKVPLAGHSHCTGVTPCDLLDERPWGARLLLQPPCWALGDWGLAQTVCRARPPRIQHATAGPSWQGTGLPWAAEGAVKWPQPLLPA